MPASRFLTRLPSIAGTLARVRALSLLEIAMNEGAVDRYFSFDAAWDEGAQMAAMNNHGGDNWFCWFGPQGAAIVGFDHEAWTTPYRFDPPKLWPGLLDGVPEPFRAPVLEEPAFAIADTTFLIWREPADATWRASDVELPDVDDPDGADHLLAPLTEDEDWYLDYVEDYYEAETDPDAVAAIYRGEPLTSELVARINPERDVQAALREAAAIQG